MESPRKEHSSYELNGNTTVTTMEKREEGLNLLLLCDYHRGSAGTIIDHIKGLQKYSRHTIRILRMMGGLPNTVELNRFDGVIVHYSLVACMDGYLKPEARERIKKFNGMKIIFIQDDYRFVNATVSAVAYMGMDLLFGLAPQDVIDEVYSPEALPGVRRETVLAGYVPEHLLGLDVPDIADRPLDVGYRARKLSAWLGSHAQEKWQIGDRFQRDSVRYGLNVDISMKESDRIYGRDWIRFLLRCKAMLGSESGSGVCDFTGEIQRNVEAHETRDSGVSFEELRNLYFGEEDGRVMMNIISPRCFEAASLRTLMILYEGNYSGRLIPWRHYVPMKRDHGNMDEVVAVLRDSSRAREIVDCAYEEVACNPDNWFRAMVSLVDGAIDEKFVEKQRAPKQPYSDKEYARVTRIPHLATQIRRTRARLFMLLGRGIYACVGIVPEGRARRLRAELQAAWRSYLRRELSVSQLILRVVSIPRNIWRGPSC